ncbi:JEN1 [Candida pseudojiufengensis]|uniref:JEN1 n=1 Tax=Candida pseudojiufengensis TaxID=497109 RepID=UPI002224D3A7|nr:JEN1 [Candida pseudojiufengensis]KAI5961631.1 JEN1 [Candida pseudojiufengensis]
MKDKPEIEQISPCTSESENSKKQQVDDNIYHEKPDWSASAIKKYFATRIPTLLDFPINHETKRWYEIVNPIPGLREMTPYNWNQYLLGLSLWLIDSFDFFCVSVNAPHIAATLNVSVYDITWGMTLVLMLRSVGAIIFGSMADKYGRKFPYILLCVLFTVIEVCSGIVTTFRQFLGVRAIFGQPTAARATISGTFVPIYGIGYSMAMIFARAFEGTYKEGESWRSLFWFSAGLSVILLVWRFFSPESKEWIRIREKKRKLKELTPGMKDNAWKKFTNASIFKTLRTDYLLLCQLTVLYAMFNFTTHGTQDLFVTMLTVQYNMSIDLITIIISLQGIAAMIGGVICGPCSELVGRRFMILICSIFNGAFLYPSFFNVNQWWPFSVVLAGGVLGCWGISSVYLLEMTNKANRALIGGLAYQLGNLASSASATIEARLAEQFPIEGRPGVYDYGKTMCIFSGAVFGAMIICIILSPERFHANEALEDDDDDDLLLEEGNQSQNSFNEKLEEGNQIQISSNEKHI